jgi:LPXTG-site transpeptidase (sortase) family protein
MSGVETVNSRTKTWISFVLVAAGIVLLFMGARDFLGSHFGQIEAQRDFDRAEQAQAGEQAQEASKGRLVEPERPKPVPLGGTMARLTIPRLHADVYVVEGDGASELRKGPGHLADSAEPGEHGNCVIAGHRDTHFRVLKDIRRGDDIVLDTPEGQYLYRVRNTRVVAPNNTSSLRPSADAVLHLITCYPFYYIGSAPKRFVVEARLVGAVGRTS